MNLESQVCSLELSKRLKELGVKQDSLVYWMNVQHCIHMKVKKNEWGMDEVEHDENGNGIIDKIDYRQELGNPWAWNVPKEDCWSAFTVAELGIFLRKRAFTRFGSESSQFICTNENFDIYIDDETEANARAKMLVYLLENKLMELPNES